MKQFWAFLASCLILMAASPAGAQSGGERPDGWGVGLGAGTGISGVSLKSQLGDDRAFQAVIGCWGGYRNECYGVGGSLDLLFNMPIIADEDVVRLGWNIGGGAAVGARGSGWARHPNRDRRGNNLWLAGQFIAGLEFIFPDVPLDLVLEWRPSLYVVPNFFGLHIDNGGFHVRYYFQ